MLGLVSLLAKVYPVITPVLGTVFRGPNAKGHAAGATLAVPVAGIDLASAIVNPVLSGFSAGIEPAAIELGTALGAFVTSYIVGFAVTWLTENTRKRAQ